MPNRHLILTTELFLEKTQTGKKLELGYLTRSGSTMYVLYVVKSASALLHHRAGRFLSPPWLSAALPSLY